MALRILPRDVLEKGVREIADEYSTRHPALQLLDMAGQCVFSIYEDSRLVTAYAVYFFIEGTGKCSLLDGGMIGRDRTESLENGWWICAVESKFNEEPESTLRKIRSRLHDLLCGWNAVRGVPGTKLSG